MTKKLSPDLILKARPANDSKGRPKQQTLIRDKEAPGLVLRVTGQGKKALIYQRRIKGGPLFHKTINAEIQAADMADIGKGIAILADARATAARFNNWITDGKDPAAEEAKEEAKQARHHAEQERAEQEAEAASKHTLARLLALYVDHLTQQGKDRSAAAARSAFKCHVPDHLAELPAREITRSQVAEIVRRVMESGKQRQAGVVRAYIHAAFETALTAESDASAPAAFIAFQVESNPARGIKAIPVRPGNRVLTAAELAAYLDHLDADRLIDRLLKLALLAGGQRLEMLMRAKGGDYDTAARSLLLFDIKGKRTTPRAHLIPLAAAAAALVQVAGPQDFIFGSSKGGRLDIGTPGKRVKEISEAMGGEPFDLRDIRRTCETHLAKIGVSQDIRAQLLSHGISGVQARHYDRHTYEKEKRAALERWEDYLLTGLVTPAEVVQLADRRATR